MTDTVIADISIAIRSCTQKQLATHLCGWLETEAGVYELRLSMEKMAEFNKLGAIKDNAKYIDM
jgi:hypothetical protein